MALFPAFAGVSEAPDGGSSRKELDWLSNPSFCVGSLPSLSHQTEEPTALVSEGAPLPRSSLKSEPADESDTDQKLIQTSRKKKKERKKKRKHQHHRKTKRRRGQSGSSESAPDTDSAEDGPSRGSRRASEKPGPGSNSAAETGRRLVWLEDVQAVTGETFRTDKKPDPANWEYKSLYRGDIARYRRKGDSCLGINPKKQCISWEGASTEKKRTRKHVERYFTKKSVGLMNIDGVAITSKTASPSAEPGPFIPVRDSDDVTAPVATWLNPLGVYDQSTTQWLQGQGPSEQESKQPDSQADRENAALKAKVEEFNRKVRENPWDTQLWMAFVAFQVSMAVLDLVC